MVKLTTVGSHYLPTKTRGEGGATRIQGPGSPHRNWNPVRPTGRARAAEEIELQLECISKQREGGKCAWFLPPLSILFLAPPIGQTSLVAS